MEISHKLFLCGHQDLNPWRSDSHLLAFPPSFITYISSSILVLIAATSPRACTSNIVGMQLLHLQPWATLAILARETKDSTATWKRKCTVNQYISCMIRYCVYISSQSLSNKLSEATGCISQLHRIKFNPSRWLVPNPNGFRKVKGSNASPGKDFYHVKEHISQHAQEALRVRCIWDKFKIQSCFV